MLQLFFLGINFAVAFKPASSFEDAEFIQRCMQGDPHCLDHPYFNYQNRSYKMLGLVKFIPLQVAALSNVLRQNCVPTAHLYRCNSGFSMDQVWAWKRRYAYSIRTSTSPGCPNSTISYHWTLADNDTGILIKDYSAYKNKPILPITFYDLKTGVYILSVIIKESIEGKPQGYGASQCLIRMVPEDPEPNISGGHYRVVQYGRDFLLDGRSSVDWDIEPGGQQDLRYKWSCQVIKGPDMDFCRKKELTVISHRPFAVIPGANNTANGSTYEFYLSVSTDGINWVGTKQQVYVSSFDLFLRLMKNCRGSVNKHLPIFIDSVCENCKGKDYDWFTRGNFKKTAFLYGDEDYRFYVPHLSLIVGKDYVLARRMDRNDDYSARVMFKIANLHAKLCTIEPKVGESLTTLFTIDCNVMKADNLIYKVTKGYSQDNVVAISEKKVLKLYLPPGASYFTVKMTCSDGIFDIRNVKLHNKIEYYISKIPPENQIQALMDVYDGKHPNISSLDRLLNLGNTDRVIQVMTILTEEAAKISKKIPEREDFQMRFKKLLFDDLRYKFPMISQDEVLQASGVMKGFRRLAPNKIDAFYLESAVQFCTSMALFQFYYVKKSPNKNSVTIDTVNLSKHVFICAAEGLRRNYSDIAPPKSQTNVSKVENQDDNVEIQRKLLSYKRATSGFVKCYRIMTLALALTLAPGEPMLEIGPLEWLGRRELLYRQNDKFANYSQGRIVGNITGFGAYIQFLKDEGRQIVGILLGAYGSFIVNHSQSLAQDDFRKKIFEVVFFAFNETPHWWDPDAHRIGGSVLSVSYYLDGEEIKRFGRPTNLLFRINNTNVNITNGSVTVPKDISQWSDQILDDEMVIYRIDMIENSALRVEFYGLQGKNKAQVAITYARRPSTKDFIIGRTDVLSEEKPQVISYIPEELTKFGDTWAYVAVLPHKDAIDTTAPGLTFTFNYNISLVTSTCVYWDENIRSWKPNICWSGRNDSRTHVSCSCLYPSTFGIFYENATYKVDTFIKIKFTLALQKNYLIFICTWLIFAIYCSALAFGFQMIKTQHLWTKRALFLSDNLQSDCYAYLIIVKTGNKPSAGTTSNIGIKIFGEIYESRAHIMNYPDPDLILLQRGKEDWFVLATKHHLGNITDINLWHDSVGQRPSWYCEWISIWDLQTEDEWYFEVNEWLCVIQNDISVLGVRPAEREDSDKWQHVYIKKMMKSNVQTNHTWNIFSYKGSNLPYLERITIMLSTFLTTYVATLILYELPSMRLKDGFDYGQYELETKTFTTAILGSLISYAPNMGLTILFKKAAQGTDMAQISKTKRYPLLPWTLIILLIITCLTLLSLCGLWVAHVTSLLWLTSTIGAIVQSALILENFYIFLESVVSHAQIIRRGNALIDIPRIIEEVEEQRRYLYPIFGGYLLRPYFSNNYRPLTVEELHSRRQIRLLSMRYSKLVFDFYMFLIYMVLLYVLVFRYQEQLHVYGHNPMKNIFTGAYTKTINFEDIMTTNDFYKYLNNTFVPSTQGNRPLRSEDLIQFPYMIDGNTQILGVTRIRQLRVHARKCAALIAEKIWNASCIPDFSYSYNDKGDYIEGWKTSGDVLVDRLAYIWKYNTDAKYSIGNIAIYPGGGYSADLHKNIPSSVKNLNLLRELGWLDRRTRAIFIEFLAYNGNTGVFYAVKLRIESSSSGLLLKSSKIFNKKMLITQFEIRLMAAVTFIIFLVIVLSKIINRSFTHKPGYWFFSISTLTDIFIVLISFSYVILYMHRNTSIAKIVDEISMFKGRSYVSHHRLVYIEYVLGFLGAALICLSFTRLFRVFSLHFLFKVIGRILADQSFQGVFLCHMLIILAYALFGYVCFGSNSKEFQSIFISATNLFLISIRSNRIFYKKLEENYGTVGSVYHVSFIAVTILMYTWYVVTVLFTYSESGRIIRSHESSFTFRKYLRNEYRYLKQLFFKRVQQRLAAGSDFTPPPKILPKEERYRYRHAVTVSEYKLYVMSLVAKCVLSNSSDNRTDACSSMKDIKLMNATVYHLLAGLDIPEPKHVSFVIKEGGTHKLLSNNRILQMENIIHHLFDINTARNSQLCTFDKNEDGSLQTIIQMQLEYFEYILSLLVTLFSHITVTLGDMDDYEVVPPDES